MKYSHKLSDAIHVLAYIKIFQHSDLTSKTIARSVESNPSLVRRLLSKLTKAKLIISTPGKAGRKLARPAKEITILDVYLALGGRNILHVDPKTNPKCVVGGNIQNVLKNVYHQVQMTAENKMKEITLQDITDQILKEHQKKNA